jgi:ethanolamine-phosphate cytidylyltransferase
MGKELVVGIHSDDAILENKGPTVMTLQERSVPQLIINPVCFTYRHCLVSVIAVEACRWVSMSVPHAPYVTSLPWVSHYGCYYVVHGDDITSDSNGEDCYRFVKAAGRFLVVKRTPGISTTDLVGRMLLCTKGHFIKSLKDTLAGKKEGAGSSEEKKTFADDILQGIRNYATDETGLQPGSEVWTWSGSVSTKFDHEREEPGIFDNIVPGKPPKPGQRIVYVDGGFDLFSSGHIEFLRRVLAREEEEARQRGWYGPSERERRLLLCDEDYGPAYMIAGIHDDDVINYWKGLNYPIMNILERGLCVLQCKVSSNVVRSCCVSSSTNQCSIFTPSYSRRPSRQIDYSYKLCP